MHRSPRLTVDGIVVRKEGVLLVQRRHDPFKDSWAIPGGFVEYGETVEEAVCREVLEETGLQVHVACLAGVYSDPHRDPRGHTVSVVFRCDEVGGRLQGGPEVLDARFFSLADLPPLAFDHRTILQETLQEI